MEKLFTEYWGAFEFISALIIGLVVWRLNSIEKDFIEKIADMKKEFLEKETDLKNELLKVENSVDELRMNHESKVDSLMFTMQEIKICIVRIETTLNLNKQNHKE